MNQKIEQLQPADVFRFFREISAIPRPSGQEEAISNYLVQFAKDRDLEWYQDDLFNVVIIKEASPGWEDREPLILQGHMDMVCEKEADCEKDMYKEGLDLDTEGDYLFARGTTLGGDDGIALAYALAFMDDRTLEHPRLEAVFTVGEEVGMNGAHAIDLSMLRGHAMVNLDMEEEGLLLAGCAGGGRSEIVLPVQRMPNDGMRAILYLHGLAGGHSGAEIHKGHANAMTLLARALRSCLPAVPFCLEALAGGTKDNAIPREGAAVLALKDGSLDELKKAAGQLQETFRSEYVSADPGLILEVLTDEQDLPQELRGLLRADLDEEDRNHYSLTAADTRTVLVLMTALPNGVVRMSQDISGLVETSLNLGIASLGQRTLNLTYSVRSSVGSAYEELASRLQFIASYMGAHVTRISEYPAWEFRAESPLRKHMADTYREMFGSEAHVDVVHAGVECGLLGGKIPGLDAVSIGPEITDIHTPAEKMSVSSVERVYRYVRKVITTWK